MCTSKVLAVYTAIRHLYHTRACDTWRVNSPCVRCERFEPPTQGLCAARCFQYGLLTGRCTAQCSVFIIAPLLAACHVACSFCHITHSLCHVVRSFGHVVCCSMLPYCAAAAISFCGCRVLRSPKDHSHAADMLPTCCCKCYHHTLHSSLLRAPYTSAFNGRGTCHPQHAPHSRMPPPKTTCKV